MDSILAHLLLGVFAVTAIFLAVILGVALLAGTPLRPRTPKAMEIGDKSAGSRRG
ncbi:hypothetical protein ACTWLT_21555 [Micromonospora sp. ZYX-F-536]|uniref:hypothetical protein n=1 Tax=Micromonospora sp. ZYX-F-536 TaxID=3457629 RepID=UPI004040A334